MAYNRNIPNATDLISNSQAQLKSNFQAIDSGTTGTGAGFSRNHVTLTDGTNGGLHSKIDYYQGLDSPSVGGVSCLYATSITGGRTLGDLYYKIGSNDLQITKSSLTPSAGEGFLPGGLQIRSGTGTIPSGSPGTVTITYATPFPTNTIAVAVSTSNANLVVQSNIQTYVAASFQAKCNNSGGSTAFAYIAIGY